MTPVHLRPIAEATWTELGRLAQSQVERRFPGRGVEQLAPWGAAALERAATSLATTADDTTSVGIVTGFCVTGFSPTSANPLAAETDGPPGALLLAGVLTAVGSRVVLVSDRYGAPLLRAGALHCGLADVDIVECPLEAEDAQRWCESFILGRPGRRLTHLVSIERAGPSHTIDSVRRQTRDESVVDRFAAIVPIGHRGRRHNMRGEVIDSVTAPLDRLFEMIADKRQATTTHRHWRRRQRNRPGCCALGVAGRDGNRCGQGAVRQCEPARPGRLPGRDRPYNRRRCLELGRICPRPCCCHTARSAVRSGY